MKTIRIVIMALALIVAGGAMAQNLGSSAGQDLDALWGRAQKTLDLDREDAAVLLESRKVTVAQDGSVATRIHRVAWIGTAVGIRAYADLRVPWNTATSDLDVEILRTWMDGRWWPDPRVISETAVVHTLPHALDHADDYTTIRETMLLHDGVELPCIMETAYTITEHEGAPPGTDGIFVFPQRDPAIRVVLEVQTPEPGNLTFQALNGGPEAEIKSLGRSTSHFWVLEDLPALRIPLTGHPEAYEPAIQWTTWKSWDEFRSAWTAAFAMGAGLSSDLADTLDSRRIGKVGPVAVVRDLAAFMNEAVRPIHYDHRHWDFNPRPAGRVFDTGYGHTLDRAELMAAALLHMGFVVTPVFVGHPLANHLSHPGQASLGDMMLWTRAGGLDHPTNPVLVYDPAHGTVHGEDILQGKTRVFMGGDPAMVFPSANPSSLGFSAVLRLDDDGDWQGEGMVEGSWGLSLHGRIFGTDNRMDAAVEEIVASVLPGAVTDFANPTVMIPDHTTLGFEIRLPAEQKSPGRIVLGNPAGGIMDHFPADLHLHEAVRQSPVLLSSPFEQTVILRFDLKGLEAAHTPSPLKIQNAAGSFEVKTGEHEGWLILERTLSIPRPLVQAEDWPALRELLLEESDPSNGTIIFEEDEE